MKMFEMKFGERQQIQNLCNKSDEFTEGCMSYEHFAPLFFGGIQ